MHDVSNLRSTIIPKSDQLNSEQLLSGDLTITVTDVRVGTSDEQPIMIHYDGEDGRPYKPCKTMRKLLLFAWGDDGRDWIGKSMTLYNDPAVQFGGAKVGGIRISHLSHIEREINVNLTSTRGKKALHTIQVLKAVTLEQVLEAIKKATNKATMQEARALAEQLTAPASLTKARDAYAARVSELKKPGATATKSVAAYIESIETAGSEEAAALVLDEATAAHPTESEALTKSFDMAWKA